MIFTLTAQLPQRIVDPTDCLLDLEISAYSDAPGGAFFMGIGDPQARDYVGTTTQSRIYKITLNPNESLWATSTIQDTLIAVRILTRWGRKQ